MTLEPAAAMAVQLAFVMPDLPLRTVLDVATALTKLGYVQEVNNDHAARPTDH